MSGPEIAVQDTVRMGRLQGFRQKSSEWMKSTRIHEAMRFDLLFQGRRLHIVHDQIRPRFFLAGKTPFQWPQDSGMVDMAQDFDLTKDGLGLLFETIRGKGLN